MMNHQQHFTRRKASPITALALLAFTGAASAATTTVVTPNGFTAPKNGFVAYGTALNADGRPVRHLWADDHLQGVCRLDPDLDTANATGQALSINGNTCFGGTTPVTGPAAYDPGTNYVYVVDEIAKGNRGVVRGQYSPSLNGGHGGIIANSLVNLAGTGTCGIGGNRGAAASVGPDGNLYVGVLKTGSLYRVTNPAAAGVPCSAVQIIGATPDGRRGLGLTWVGHDLYGLDGAGPFVIKDADKCVTPANNGAQCVAEATFDGAAILAAGIGSDQDFNPRAAAGTTVYLGDVNNVIKITQPGSLSPVIDNAWTAGQANASGFAVDPQSAPNTVYVFDDRTAGAQTFQGKLFKVVESVVAAAPSAPTNIVATAGDAGATVSWTASKDNGAPITQYNVNTMPVGSPTVVATTVVTANGGVAVPTTAEVTGLQNGVEYLFSVEAVNAAGKTMSATFSNSVIPKAAAVPSAPQNVTATPGDSSVQVAWGTPLSNGGKAITSYIVRTSNNGADVDVSVAAPTNGLLVTGLQNGASYTFQVIAVNAIGSSDPSQQTAPVTPTVGRADLNVALSGPTSLTSGASATYVATVTNVGSRSLPGVRLMGTLPVTGMSATTASGSCSIAGTALDCNLGPFALNKAATVTLSATSLTASGSTQVTGESYDLQGVLLSDVNTADNTASVTTSIVNPPPSSTTDLSLGGKVNFGGAVNSAASYTFTVSNGGAAAANLVQFITTLNPGLRFGSATAPNGWTCTAPASGSAGGTVTCKASTLLARGTANITIGATPTVTGTIATTGSVSFAGTDTRPSNDSVSVSIRVR